MESSCIECGAKITYEPISCLGVALNIKPGLCDACGEKRARGIEHDMAEEQKKNSISQLPYRWDSAIGNKKAYNDIGRMVFRDKQFVPRSLWIGGVSGAGKTTVCCGLAEVMAERGFKFKWCDCHSMMRHYSAMLGQSMRDAEDYIDGIASYRGLLIMDDVGNGKITGRGEEALFDVFDTRLRKKLATWVTSNLKPEGLRRWIEDHVMSERLIRRVNDMFEVVEVKKHGEA